MFICVVLFIIVVFVIFCGILYELCWCGNFVDIWYLYCGFMVFICVVLLFMVVKNKLNVWMLSGLGFIFCYLLGIYGFYVLIIYVLCINGLELKCWLLLDIVWVFVVMVIGSLLFFMLL